MKWSNPAALAVFRSPLAALLFRQHRLNYALLVVLVGWIPNTEKLEEREPTLDLLEAHRRASQVSGYKTFLFKSSIERNDLRTAVFGSGPRLFKTVQMSSSFSLSRPTPSLPLLHLPVYTSFWAKTIFSIAGTIGYCP